MAKMWEFYGEFRAIERHGLHWQTGYTWPEQAVYRNHSLCWGL